MATPPDEVFRERIWAKEVARPGDRRDAYERDRARILHSAAFRRLQGKTQVMGVGEGDFHRTRLTHSIEAAQIGEGLLRQLSETESLSPDARAWLPSAALVTAACFAHDLGHPPFGHGGERALHRLMLKHGGFEGNGQTLRILTRLEKIKAKQGINPTVRLALAVLKYPASYSSFDLKQYQDHPPKCYLDTEEPLVTSALSRFAPADLALLRAAREPGSGKPTMRTLDSSLMECADDIAYAVHDLEDIVARHLVGIEGIRSGLEPVFAGSPAIVGPSGERVSLDEIVDRLFRRGSAARKDLVGQLVNLFVTSASIVRDDRLEHPLLRYRLTFHSNVTPLLAALKKLTFTLVVDRPSVQHLERRGERLIEDLFRELSRSPDKVIPADAWEGVDSDDSPERRVCDYIAGMTDSFAERLYRRLFEPGFGSSTDEI